MTKQEFLDNLGLNICTDGVKSFIGYQGSINDYFNKHPRGTTAYLWCCQSKWFASTPFYSESFAEACASIRPTYAMMYVGDKLPAKVVNSIAHKSPEIAFKYVIGMLTPETIDRCARVDFQAALDLIPNKLSADTLKWCREQEIKKYQNKKRY